ncbi:MAG: glycerol kinase GlpK [Clostridium sp.]
MEKYILVIDSGTTNVKASFIDKTSKVVCSVSSEFPVYYPEDGLTEESATVIWGTTVEMIRMLMTKSGVSEEEIHSIGITNQRETFVIWNKNTGVPVYNAIGWADRRGIPFCMKLVEEGYMGKIYQKTGMPLTSFNAVSSKAMWVLDNVPGIREQAEHGDLLLGTIETWLIWNLTQGESHVTDISNASHSMYLDINTLQWDQELLDIFRTPRSMLPELRPTSGLLGYATGIFHRNIPIMGAIGDSQSATLGHLCLEKGMIKSSYGTACLMTVNMGTEPSVVPGLLTTIGWKIGDKVSYLYEGGFYTAGLALKWMRDTVRFIDNYETMNQRIHTVERTPGFYVCPSFLGVATPYFSVESKGMVAGINIATNVDDIMKGVADSMAYMTRDCIEAFCDGMDAPAICLMVDGGVTKSDDVLQFIADINGVEVHRSSDIEATTIGAAYAAGLADGYWKDPEDIKANLKSKTTIFKSQMDSEEVAKLYSGWKRVLQMVLDYAKPLQEGSK